MKLDFFKYQALGNDMLVIDPAHFETALTPETVRRLCNRHFGVGGDGVCFGPLPEGGSPPAMRFFNPDGSEAEKSGNGLRIFARYLWDAGYAQTRLFDIAMGGERIPVTVEDATAQELSLGMGRLSFGGEQSRKVAGAQGSKGTELRKSESQLAIRNSSEVIEQPVAFGDTTFSIATVSIGNPHCVIFVGGDEDLARLARQWGPVIETAPQFPQRTNVQFVQRVDGHTITIEIWERGAGYTLASGTSASAAAGAAIKTGRCRSPMTVQMAGGAARVAVDAGWEVTLTGPVAAVCRGQLAPEVLST